MTKRAKRPSEKAVFKRGCSGTGVDWVHYSLGKHGYKLKRKQYFDIETERCIIDFQRSRGLKPNGVVEALTIENLAQKKRR